MARDIPEAVPESIAQLIYAGWGDMKSFSVAIGLPYTSVYSVLVKSAHRPLHNLMSLAKPLEISAEGLADILLVSNLDIREKLLDTVLDGKSRNQWAREAGISSGTLSHIVNNLEQSQLRNIVTIINALGLDAKRFSARYSRCKIAS